MSWPYTTPSGHTYNVPTTYEELSHLAVADLLGQFEHWDKAERPPDPTWDMLDLAHREIRLLREAVRTAEIQSWGLDMGGHHSLCIKGHGRRLNPEQWAAVGRAVDP